jgi:mannose-1-phosphate guanylyltransferase
LSPLFTPDRVLVSTSRDYLDMLRADAPEIPLDNFIVEPYGKNNGPAVGLAMSVIHRRDPAATVALVASDHHIARPDSFHEALSAAYELAQVASSSRWA